MNHPPRPYLSSATRTPPRISADYRCTLISEEPVKTKSCQARGQCSLSAGAPGTSMLLLTKARERKKAEMREEYEERKTHLRDKLHIGLTSSDWVRPTESVRSPPTTPCA